MLKSQKRAMGGSAFAALYQGTPTAAEGAIIKAGWLNRLIDDEVPKEFDITYLALDTAFSEKESADESVICVAGYNKNDPDKIYIRELVHGRWSFPDLIATLEQTQKYYRAKFLCIEQAASGQSLIQVLERETKIHIHKFKPLKSKSIRLQTVSPLFESGKVYFCDGIWVDSFFKEITAFPAVPHDDKTDAVCWAITYFLFHMAEGGGTYANAFNRTKAPGRAGMFEEFTEIGKKHNSRGRRSLFGAGSAGETYRFGTETRNTRRSDDLKYDT